MFVVELDSQHYKRLSNNLAGALLQNTITFAFHCKQGRTAQTFIQYFMQMTRFFIVPLIKKKEKSGIKR